MDWANFWAATTAAATIATAVSTGAVLWLRRREKPWPEWLLTGYMTNDFEYVTEGEIEMPNKPFRVRAKLTNVGDGTAFVVALSGEDCAPSVSGGSLSVMKTGDEVGVDGSAERESANQSLTVTWLASPTRLGQRWSQTIWLDETLSVGGQELARSSQKRRRKPRRVRSRTRLRG